MNKKPNISEIARSSGGFAMLAVDQREAMRAMFTEQMAGTVASDEMVIDFKIAAAKTLTPFASAVLVDRQFALQRFLNEPIVDQNCAVIAAADEFIAGPGEFVADVRIDRNIDPFALRSVGVIALKLLVIHRPDIDRVLNITMVQEFVSICRDAGLISIIEPIAKAPRYGGDWNWNREVQVAAEYLGNLGADLYKAEVPLHGIGSDSELLKASVELGQRITSPWVVLSSGVESKDFPRAVAVAVAAGASGFLAGRAVWRECLTPSGYQNCLATVAVQKLRLLAETVDTALLKRNRQ